MKNLFNKYKYHALILLAVWSFFSGCKIFYESFGKPNGLEDKYPLFLLNISLIAIYAIPLILLTRYLAKRFEISKKVIHLSWVMALTASVYFSDIGHTIVGYITIVIFKIPDSIRADWGPAIGGPLAEEFGKGLAVLLVLLILKKMDLKNALVSGMIIGLCFQIIEDCNFTFQEIFLAKADGFSVLLERIAFSGGTHWVFTLIFAIGIVALIAKDTGIIKIQGLVCVLLAILMHFIYNTPFNEGIGSNTGNFTVLLLTLNLSLALLAFKTVDKVVTHQKGQFPNH